MNKEAIERTKARCRNVIKGYNYVSFGLMSFAEARQNDRNRFFAQIADAASAKLQDDILRGRITTVTPTFVIVEKTDIGERDTIYGHLLATDSPYGGDFMPSFNSKDDAISYLNGRNDNHRRKFEVVELHSCTTP
jgi:hypothetical protein